MSSDVGYASCDSYQRPNKGWQCQRRYLVHRHFKAFLFGLNRLKIMALQAKRAIVELQDATVDTCGSKAAACARLARVSEQEGSFSTPSGVCLPFGNMEHAVEVTYQL